MEYKCDRCGYTTKYKHCLINHLQKQTPCLNTHSNISRDELISIIKKKDYNNITYKCKYCENKFNNSSSRTRHQKNCRVKDEENYNELLEKIYKLTKDLEETKKTHLYNITITNTYNNNININSFGREDINHLPLEFMTSCFMMKNIPALIEHIYFDDDYPQNKTIKLKSLKNKTVLIYDSGHWITKPTNRVLDELINKGQTLLKKHYIKNPSDVHDDMSHDEIEDVLSWLQEIWNENIRVRSSIKNDLMAILETYRVENISMQ